MRLMRLPVLFIFLLSLSFVQKSLARVQPSLPWLTLKTDHFHVHHTKEQTVFAQSFGFYLEKHLLSLTVDLAWTPSTPIDIIVNDNTDKSNGLARSFPINSIEVFPVPFSGESSLMEYHNWVEELAVHELTHIVANDTVNGFYNVLKSIFGTAIRPNGVQPGWLTEGLAVYEESQLTLGGRGRSVFTEALLRTIVRYNKLYSKDYIRLDRLNDGVLWWPASNTPYIMGYALQASLMRYSKVGQSIPGLISSGNSSRIPFTLNENLENILGMDWEQALGSFQKIIERRYKKQEITNEICQLTQAGKFTGGMSLHKSGWIYFMADHPETGTVLARIHKDSPCLSKKEVDDLRPQKQKKRFEVLVKRIGSRSARVSVSPDENWVAYANIVRTDYTSFNDIFLYDMKKKESLRLTFEKRAHSPSFTPDGSHVLYVRNLGGYQKIEMMNVETKEVRDVFKGKAFERLDTPVLQGGSVYFSRHNNQGQDEIIKVTQKDKIFGSPVPAISYSRKGKQFSERHPHITPQGVIYYTGTYGEKTNDGVRWEIYRWQAGTKPQRLTWTISGLSLWPIPIETSRQSKDKQSNDDLLVAGYTLNGFNIMRLSTKKTMGVRQARKGEEPMHEYLVGKKVDLPPPVEYKNPSKGKTYSFTPAASFWPKYIVPIGTLVTDGFVVGGITSFQDPFDHKAILALGMYDSRADFPTYSLSYIHAFDSIVPRITIAQSNNYISSFQSSNRYNSYGINFLIPRGFFSFSSGFDYEVSEYLGVTRKTPSAFFNFRMGFVRAKSSLSNRGFKMGSSLVYYPPSNEEESFWRISPGVELYFSGLSKSHNLGLQANVGFFSNDAPPNKFFLGGGESTELSFGSKSSSYEVRGYPIGTLFGKKIVTLNLNYTVPLGYPQLGWDVHPIFFEQTGVRLLLDAGSASEMGKYSNDGESFLGYKTNSFGKNFIFSSSLEFLLGTKVAYSLPLLFRLGLHRGWNKSFGGETRVFFGVKVKLPGRL